MKSLFLSAPCGDPASGANPRDICRRLISLHCIIGLKLSFFSPFIHTNNTTSYISSDIHGLCLIRFFDSWRWQRRHWWWWWRIRARSWRNSKAEGQEWSKTIPRRNVRTNGPAGLRVLAIVGKLQRDSHTKCSCSRDSSPIPD